MRPRTLSPAQYRRVTSSALAALAFIVVTGAAVRLTGSGLGCPTWPNCEPDRLVPHSASDVHAVIEFVNRTVTGLVSVAVAVAVLGSRIRRPRRRDLTWWSLSLVAGVVGQIVLGGLTVLFDLAPPLVMGHFLLSMVLVLCAVVLHHRASEPDAGTRRPLATASVATMSRVLVGAATVVLVTGTAVTGAGPHGGDETVRRLDLAVPDAARVHAVAVWLLVLGTLWALRLVHRGDGAPAVDRALRALLAVEVAQGAVGYLQYFTDVPVVLVGIHVLGATLVWIATLHVLLSTTEVVAVEPAPAPRPTGVPA